MKKRLKLPFRHIIKRVFKHTWLKIRKIKSLNSFSWESWNSFIDFFPVTCDETSKLLPPHRFDLIMKGVKQAKLLFCSSACYHRMPKSENLPLWKLHVKSFSLARSRDVVFVWSFDFEVKHRLFSFRVFPVRNKHSTSYNGKSLLCWIIVQKSVYVWQNIFIKLSRAASKFIVFHFDLDWNLWLCLHREWKKFIFAID